MFQPIISQTFPCARRRLLAGDWRITGIFRDLQAGGDDEGDDYEGDSDA